MKVGSLFSGIGGLDLGLEWAGMDTEWFCEIEPFAQEVLKRHWPDKTIISDIRDINEEAIAEGLISPVDVIAGGFPCQDLSYAGKRRGLDYDLDTGEGTRSGLWWEMWRVIRLLRPRYVIAENVPGLFTGGIDIVLGSLAQIGYDAEWEVLSAGIMDSRGNALTGVGAPHQRDRVFIVAYRNDLDRGAKGAGGEFGGVRRARGEEAQDGGIKARDVADSNDQGLEGRSRNAERGGQRTPWEGGGHSWFGGIWPQPWPVSFKREDVADTEDVYVQGQRDRPRQGQSGGGGGAPQNLPRELERMASVGDVRGVADGLSSGLEQEGVMWPTANARDQLDNYICTDVPDRTGRLKGLGNAVVPQVGYLVGRAVMEHAKETGRL